MQPARAGAPVPFAPLGLLSGEAAVRGLTPPAEFFRPFGAEEADLTLEKGGSGALFGWPKIETRNAFIGRSVTGLAQNDSSTCQM